MKSRKIWFLVGSLLVLSLLFAPGGHAAPKGVVTMALSTIEDVYLDPHSGSSGTSLPIVRIISDGLTYQSLDGKIVPNLATSWKVSPDGLTWTFTLKKGVKYHNGMTMVAEDVKLYALLSDR